MVVDVGGTNKVIEEDYLLYSTSIEVCQFVQYKSNSLST